MHACIISQLTKNMLPLPKFSESPCNICGIEPSLYTTITPCPHPTKTRIRAQLTTPKPETAAAAARYFSSKAKLYSIF